MQAERALRRERDLVSRIMDTSPVGILVFDREGRITFANPSEEIEQEDLPLVFERFYRGEKSRSRDYGGAGIGLSVVKDLIEAHKGKVGAGMENDEFQVWFTLPNKPLQ